MIKFGNHKLGDDTAIFNMGTAADCPSRKLGLCNVTNKGFKCYALKAEQQYPNTVPNARKRQENYWRSTDAYTIAKQIKQKVDRRRKYTRFLRFNESGDFHNQEDIEKLSNVARIIKPMGIITYGYTARSDLDFSNADFLVKGSGHSRGNNGQTTVIGKNEVIPDGYIECPGSCKKCNLCKINVPHNIAFRKH